jgi:hypothetical protein
MPTIQTSEFTILQIVGLDAAVVSSFISSHIYYQADELHTAPQLLQDVVQTVLRLFILRHHNSYAGQLHGWPLARSSIRFTSHTKFRAMPRRITRTGTMMMTGHASSLPMDQGAIALPKFHDVNGLTSSRTQTPTSPFICSSLSFSLSSRYTSSTRTTDASSDLASSSRWSSSIRLLHGLSWLRSFLHTSVASVH